MAKMYVISDAHWQDCPFKVGEEVKLISSTYIDNEYNPRWCGKCGKISGKIKAIVATPTAKTVSVRVEWSTGKTNQYLVSDLEVIEKSVEQIIMQIDSTKDQKLFRINYSSQGSEDAEDHFYASNVKEAARYAYCKYGQYYHYYVHYGSYLLFKKEDYRPSLYTLEEAND